MRVIGAGLAMFLAVTAILLYQVSSGSGETVAVAGVASPEPTVTASLTPIPSPTMQPTRAMPTATMTVALPTATAPTATIEPTALPIETEVIVEEPAAIATEVIEPDPIEEAPVTEPTVEPTIAADDDSEAHLAGVDTSDAWIGAIETPNGGVIGTILSGLANVRVLPTVDAAVVDVLHAGWPVAIYGAEVGDVVDGTDLWYQVSGGYVSAAIV
ncbi:MAG: hypothetical protein M3439_00710, partial [Chloroflexota bacterium]|nr:hypothetical protein [Chloroflexota bacterium]